DRGRRTQLLCEAPTDKNWSRTNGFCLPAWPCALSIDQHYLGIMACGLRKSLEGPTHERPDPRRTAGVGRSHSPARALARLAAPGAAAVSRLQARHGLIGRSNQLDEMLARLEKVAPSEANVCILGESGTGKELPPQAIHNLSRRADRPFVILDCTAIPE